MTRCEGRTSKALLSPPSTQDSGEEEVIDLRRLLELEGIGILLLRFCIAVVAATSRLSWMMMVAGSTAVDIVIWSAGAVAEVRNVEAAVPDFATMFDQLCLWVGRWQGSLIADVVDMLLKCGWYAQVGSVFVLVSYHLT